MWEQLVKGILALLSGVLLLFRPFVEWYVEGVNSMRGVKTEISKATITTFRLVGYLFLVTGVVLIAYTLLQ
jgi:uncharacterized membrane protein HdeD (DUF308 family)